MKQFFAGRHYAVSQLALSYREALETLVFFNQEQWRMRDAMLHSIERYGSPRIGQKDQHLVLELPRLPDVQSLFILKDEARVATLSGVVVFTREESSLRVIFVGLRPEEAYGSGGEPYLLVEIFRLLRTIGQRVRGIRFIEFNNGRRFLRLSVHEPSGA